MWKKGSILLLAFLLLLTGCSSQASLVRDAMVKSWDNPNYDYKGTLKLVGDFQKLNDVAGDKMDDEAKMLLSTLQSGVTLEGSQKDINTGKIVLTLNEDKILRDHNLWTGDQKASMEVLVNKQDVYLKSPLDTKYLALSPSTSGTPIDPAKLKEFQEKLQTLMISFMKKYVAQYGYKLSNVTNHGQESVQLPNGEKVDTTHISIAMDAKEILNLLLYTAKDATTNQEVRTFAIDLLTLVSQYSDPKDSPLPPGLDQRKQAELMVDMALASMKKEIENFEKTNSVDKLLADAKKKGLEGLTLNFDYYINADKLPVQSSSKILVTFKDPQGKVKDPFTFGLESQSQIWNWGKSTSFSFPTADQTVSEQQLAKDPNAIKAFNEKGFFYQLLKMALAEEHMKGTNTNIMLQ